MLAMANGGIHDCMRLAQTVSKSNDSQMQPNPLLPFRNNPPTYVFLQDKKVAEDASELKGIKAEGFGLTNHMDKGKLRGQEWFSVMQRRLTRWGSAGLTEEDYIWAEGCRYLASTVDTQATILPQLDQAYRNAGRDIDTKEQVKVVTHMLSITLSAADRSRLAIRNAELLYSAERYEECLAFLMGVEERKDDRDTLQVKGMGLLQARSLIRLGRISEALRTLKELSNQPGTDEQNIQVLALVGWTHMRKGDKAEAFSTFKRVVTEFPNVSISKRLAVITRDIEHEDSVQLPTEAFGILTEEFNRIKASHPDDPSIKAFSERLDLIKELSATVIRQVDGIRQSAMELLLDDIDGRLAKQSFGDLGYVRMPVVEILGEYEEHFSQWAPSASLSANEVEQLDKYLWATIDTIGESIAKQVWIIESANDSDVVNVLELAMVLPLLCSEDAAWSRRDVEALPEWMKSRRNLIAVEEFCLKNFRPLSAYQINHYLDSLNVSAERSQEMLLAEYLAMSADRMFADSHSHAGTHCLRTGLSLAQYKNDINEAVGFRFKLAKVFFLMGHPQLAADEMLMVLREYPSSMLFGKAVASRIKYLYEAGDVEKALREIEGYEDDERSGSYTLEIMYLSWIIHRKLDNLEVAREKAERFLELFPNHGLAAEIRFALAVDALSVSDISGAMLQLWAIEANYPHASRLKQAVKMREQLNKVERSFIRHIHKPSDPIQGATARTDLSANESQLFERTRTPLPQAHVEYKRGNSFDLFALNDGDGYEDVPRLFSSDREVNGILMRAMRIRIWTFQDSIRKTWPLYDQQKQGIIEEWSVEVDIADATAEDTLKSAQALQAQFWQAGGGYSRNSYLHIYNARSLLELARDRWPTNLSITDELVQAILSAQPRKLYAVDTDTLVIDEQLDGLILQIRSEQFTVLTVEIEQGRDPTLSDFIRVFELAVLQSRYEPENAKHSVEWLQQKASDGGWTGYNAILKKFHKSVCLGKEYSYNIYTEAKAVYPGDYRYMRRLPSFRWPVAKERGSYLWGKDVADSVQAR